MVKCCCCISLVKGVRLIGICLFVLTLGLFVSYLVFIEEFRRNVLQKFYDIMPCDQPNIDRLIDTSVEYSLLCNILVMILCTNGSCNTRWLLMPWMVVYMVDILLLTLLSIFLFIRPLPLLPEHRPEFEALRCFGLVPLAIAAILAYCWYMVRSLFHKMSSDHIDELNDKRGSGSAGSGSTAGLLGGGSVSIGGGVGGGGGAPTDVVQHQQESCCSLQLKTGVQIITGFIALASTVVLAAYYTKFDFKIEDKYTQLFRQEPSKAFHTGIATSITISIVANLLVIVGCSGSRWRRVFLLPWLIIYGFGIILAFVAHQWLTTLCWVEEKIYGVISLVLGFLTLMVWTLVWIVAAEAAEKPKVMVGRNSLGFSQGFQRL